MLKKSIFAIALTILVTFSYGQNIDSLKLNDNEILAGYASHKNLLCRTVHSSSFYDQADVYSTFLGNIKRKEFQSFEKKGDKGSILYFEFEKDFQGQAFLEGLLWGDAGKPTKAKPDEYMTKGNVLVIWSFGKDSEIKKLSQSKVALAFE